MTSRQRIIWRRISQRSEESILRYYGEHPGNIPDGSFGFYLAIRAFEAGRKFEAQRLRRRR